MGQKISYTPSQPSYEVEVPEGYELVYSEPRVVKDGESYISALGFEIGNVISPGHHAYRYHIDTHPVLGNKRFIVNKVFAPKFGDIVEVSDDNVNWKRRIYTNKSVTGNPYCLPNVESFSEIDNDWVKIADGQTISTTPWRFIRPVQK